MPDAAPGVAAPVGKIYSLAHCQGNYTYRAKPSNLAPGFMLNDAASRAQQMYEINNLFLLNSTGIASMHYHVTPTTQLPLQWY